MPGASLEDFQRRMGEGGSRKVQVSLWKIREGKHNVLVKVGEWERNGLLLGKKRWVNFPAFLHGLDDDNSGFYFDHACVCAS